MALGEAALAWEAKARRGEEMFPLGLVKGDEVVEEWVEEEGGSE